MNMELNKVWEMKIVESLNMLAYMKAKQSIYGN